MNCPCWVYVIQLPHPLTSSNQLTDCLVLAIVRLVRWLNAGSIPILPQALKYNTFETNPLSDKPLTAAQKYTNAVSAMQAICGELADIADDDEYQEHLDFLLAQWRNIRQRKRIKLVSGSPDQDDDDEYKRPSDADDDEDGQSPAASCSSSRSSAEEAGEDDRRDRVEPPSQQSSVSQLSQPHSLYSEELGHVPIVSSKIVTFAPQMTTMRSPKGKRQARAAKKTSKSNASSHPGSDDDFEPSKPPLVKIRINPRASKAGRPKLDKKHQAADEQQKRVRFNATEKHRRDLGDVSLTQLMATVNDEKPGLLEASKRVTPIPVKYKEAVNKKPKFQEQKNPVLNAGAFYLLPKALLKSCCKVMPPNDENSPIAVDSSQRSDVPVTHDLNMDVHGLDADAAHHPDENVDDRPGGGAAVTQVVRIAGVGTFSRQQIEAMLMMTHLQEDCAHGQEFITWMRQVVASSVPAAMQRAVLSTADEVENQYPYENITGISCRCQYASLYRVMQPRWFDNALIAAFCERLCRNHDGIHYAGVADGLPKSRNSKQQHLPQPIADTAAKLLASVVAREAAAAAKVAAKPVQGQSEDPTMTTAGQGQAEERAGTTEAQRQSVKARLADEMAIVLLIPVNFGNYHWCSMVVDLTKRRILYYDSLNGIGRKGGLEQLSWDLVRKLDTKFEVVCVNSPIQFDGWSCGLFVCMKFWGYVNRGMPKDVTPAGIVTMRFRFLHFLLFNTIP
jgi:hypothetical protein